MIYAAGETGRLAHWALELDALEHAADYVTETIRAAYPTLAVPYHSRWRHFAVGGIDRWSALAMRLGDRTRDEIARSRIDLAVASVLLDAGAGEHWSYREPSTGRSFARSEGLAVASIDLFAAGAFSARRDDPLRVDARTLATLDGDALAAGLQVTAANPLPGLAGRARLLRGLGNALAARPDLFGEAEARPGSLLDYFRARADAGQLPATVVLETLLDGLAGIWPGRLMLDGRNLGDVWRHPIARSDRATDGLVPFHKLSQWLAYSLIEPLEDAGVSVIELDALTGLAEYRNGGLFIDTGVLRPKERGILAEVHPVDVELVVEWRALTIALLDRLAPRVRARLGVTAAAFPLAKMLEGGTWSAGRRIARELRPDGSPPLRVASDGTVF
jgi:hypothetical protein